MDLDAKLEKCHKIIKAALNPGSSKKLSQKHGIGTMPLDVDMAGPLKGTPAYDKWIERYRQTLASRHGFPIPANRVKVRPESMKNPYLHDLAHDFLKHRILQERAFQNPPKHQ